MMAEEQSQQNSDMVYLTDNKPQRVYLITYSNKNKTFSQPENLSVEHVQWHLEEIKFYILLVLKKITKQAITNTTMLQ